MATKLSDQLNQAIVLYADGTDKLNDEVNAKVYSRSVTAAKVSA